MEKTGESTRQLKVAKEIQKEMAEIIRSKGMAAFGGALVSVSGVKISPDLSIAKIYVSIFPSDKADAVMIGDRYHDIEGAKNIGIDSIGVIYGYGSREEFEATGATYIAETPADIEKILS